MGTVMEYLNPVVAILDGLSLPVKIAWGVWLAWGATLLAWHYWTSREPRVASRLAAEAREPSIRPVAVRPAATRKAAAPSVAPYGTSDFLAALDQEQAALAAHGQPNSSSAYR